MDKAPSVEKVASHEEFPLHSHVLIAPDDTGRKWAWFGKRINGWVPLFKGELSQGDLRAIAACAIVASNEEDQ